MNVPSQQTCVDGLWILECARAERGAKFEIYRARFPPPNPELKCHNRMNDEVKCVGFECHYLVSRKQDGVRPSFPVNNNASISPFLSPI